MGSKDFYSSKSYREKQGARTKSNWQKGSFNFLIKIVRKTCSRAGCEGGFTVQPSDPKKYCSQRCAAIVGNKGKSKSLETRAKIREALIGRSYPGRQRGITMTEILCQNPDRQKLFMSEPWKHAQYCSNKCAMKVIGGRATSPRAARGKAGTRQDIDSHTYFYSRWEANFARVMNFLNIAWIHQPKSFQLRSQKYTPDFYLPATDTYIEIKNFLSDYARNRDMQFRLLYPHVTLILILKEDYLALQKKYASNILGWEYNSSPVENSPRRIE